jgi:ABC-type lipoprotein export system ATPase subunit
MFTLPFLNNNNHKNHNHEESKRDDYMVDLRDVYKSYKTSAGDYPVLKGIDLQIGRGEFVSVIGKSGSGKSTLLNMITGIDRPSSGEIKVNGKSVNSLGEGSLSRWRGNNIGIVFQFFQLLPMLSVIENIMLPMDFCNTFPKSEREQRALDLLDLVGLADHAYKLPTALSGGQQQRVAIARALVNDPPVVIADEPTGNLDSKTAESVFELFNKLVAEGKTIIVVTHDSSLAKRATRTALIADGEIANEYMTSGLRKLDPEKAQALSSNKPVRVFDAGALIMQPETAEDQYFLITKGVVEIVLQRSDAADVMVAQLGPGYVVGRRHLFHGKGHVALARASDRQAVEAVQMDAKTLNGFLEPENNSTRSIPAEV